MNTVPFQPLQVFLAVARLRSFSSAARELGVTRSAASHSVQQLEGQLGVTLLTRTTRSVAVTDAGRRLMEGVGTAFGQIVGALGEVSAKPGEVVGRLRLSVPRLAAPFVIDPVLPVFRERHPRIEVDVAVSDRLVDIVAEGFDAGVRSTDVIERDMVQVRLTGPFRFVVVGAPAYLERHGTPQRPEDLLRHECLTFRSQTTVQRYLSRVRTKPPDGQRWSTFLHQQAAGIRACDFVEVRDLWFRCHYVFVIIHVETRQLIHAASTMVPTAAWTIQQIRDLTAFGNGPKFLLRDNDGKFTATFDEVARGAGIRVVRTPVRAPKAAAFVERFIGSLRRECLDHVLLLGESHLQRVLAEYGSYFNGARPHQGIDQRRPAAFSSPALSPEFVPGADVEARRMLGGLHHDYRLAA